MSSIVLINPQPRHCALFLDAAKRSNSLHRPWVYPPKNTKDFNRYLERMRKPNQMGLFAFEDTELVGVVNIHEIVKGNFKSAYLGYYAFAPHHQQGKMGQALHLVINECFDELKLHRVEANIQPENTKSIRLVKRLGFRLEGLSKRYLKVGGQWRDHERWALLREEWSRN